jgi:hypothetical protein
MTHNDKASVAKPTDQKQFFCIRGHMKSGTNWVCRLLNLHPDIHSSGEYHWNKYFDAYQQNRKILVNIDRIESETGTIRKHLEAMVRGCMVELADPAARLIGDRTPATIHPVILKDASYICVIRDLRDIVVSKAFHTLNAPRVLSNFSVDEKLKALKPKFDADPWFFQKQPQELLDCEEFIRKTCRIWKRTINADHHTAKVHKNIKVKFVQYEDLHQNFRPVLNQLFRFLDADPSLVTVIPKWIQPGHSKEKPNGFNRKGQVGDWRNYMTAAAKEWINEEAGKELLELGYIDSLDWSFEDVGKRKKVA